MFIKSSYKSSVYVDKGNESKKKKALKEEEGKSCFSRSCRIIIYSQQKVAM